MNIKINKNNNIDTEKLNNIFNEISDVMTQEIGITPYEEQIDAAKQILNGNILEMYTGEGKSVVNVLASIAIILTEQSKYVHIFTANEYLAQRDYEEFNNIFNKMNVTLGVVLNEDNINTKKENYKKQVIYTASHNVGFDYLRQNTGAVNDITFDNSNYDNTFAIIDEIDSILLDKGNTPLILSEPGEIGKDIFKIDKIISKLSNNKHYYIEKNNVILTNKGVHLVEKRLFLADSLFSKKNSYILKYVYNSLNAHYKMRKNVDYIVKNNTIINVDPMTGRLLFSQKYSDGLHQAIEVKEGLKPSDVTITNAVTTIQSHFKLYSNFAGLTGTSYLARKEFKDIFNKKVVIIPRRKPLKRVDETYTFLTKDETYTQMITLLNSYKMLKNPILIGCQTVHESEYVSKLLHKNNIKHNLLNAKSDKDEADIIKDAGNLGSVTVATNMAGRGTDIKLEKSSHGLIVIGLGVSISPRIDEQLRGRSGRQGDPGKSYLLISYEDDFINNYVDKDLTESAINIIKKYADSNHSYFKEAFVLNKIQKFQKSHDDNQANSRKDNYYYDALLGKQRDYFYNYKSTINQLFINKINRLNNDRDIEMVQDNYYQYIEELDTLYKSHLQYFNDLKKTIFLSSYEGVEPKLKFQEMLNSHFGQITEITKNENKIKFLNEEGDNNEQS